LGGGEKPSPSRAWVHDLGPESVGAPTRVTDTVPCDTGPDRVRHAVRCCWRPVYIAAVGGHSGCSPGGGRIRTRGVRAQAVAVRE